jgi:hypothetical protein
MTCVALLLIESKTVSMRRVRILACMYMDSVVLEAAKMLETMGR